MRIRAIVNSRVHVHASLQLDQSRACEFSDMAKSRMRTREFALILYMSIRDYVISRIRAR